METSRAEARWRADPDRRRLHATFASKARAPVAGEGCYFFLHVPKTAGTSLRNMLWQMFPEDRIYPNRRVLDPETGNPNLYYHSAIYYAPRAALANPLLVAGHFPLVARDILPKPVKTITFLRDPLERALSHLKHVQRQRPHLTLMQLLDDRELRTVCCTERMTWFFSRKDGEEAIYSRLSVPDRARLEMAKEGLATVEFIGLTEEFEESIRLCEAMLGLRFPPTMRDNVATEVEEPLGPVRERLLEDVQLDRELYDFGLQLHRDMAQRLRRREHGSGRSLSGRLRSLLPFGFKQSPGQ
jgi:hypothetical protein